MAIKKSAKKAIRQSEKRRERNLSSLNKVKDLTKEVRGLSASEAKKRVSAIYQALDKAAKTGVIKKNTASRKKSRIASFVKKLK